MLPEVFLLNSLLQKKDIPGSLFPLCPFPSSHALALAMQPQEAFHVAMLSSGSQEIRQYLMGQTFSWGGEKGWYLICVDGYSIGWGKLAGGIMKNHYPKGLRMVDII